MEKLVIAMHHKKTTKGTEVFASEDTPVRSLYIGKEAFSKGVPDSITLTVDWTEED